MMHSHKLSHGSGNSRPLSQQQPTAEGLPDHLDRRYQRFYQLLCEFLPSERLITHPLLTYAYGTDASFYRLTPKMVVRVESEAEVVRLLQQARREGVPVTFRAAGTSLSGQAISDSVLMILGDQWRGHEVLDGGQRIRLQPGVIGQWANDWLKPYQRKIGPDPASIHAAKIGGIVANNSSGMCCGTAQNTYHTLDSMRLVLVDGTVLDTADPQSVAAFRVSHGALLQQLSQLADHAKHHPTLADKIRHKYRLKNTTGYALNSLIDFEDPIDILMHLMVGSEGTLGFISEVVYRTVEDPPHKASALVVFAEAKSCCQAVAALKHAPVSAVELIDGRGLASVRDKAGLPAFIQHLDLQACALLIESRANSEAALQQQLAEIHQVLQPFTILQRTPFTTVEAEYAAYWAVRKGLFPAVGAVRETGTTVIIEDVAFPVPDLAAGVEKLQALFEQFGYHEALIFGHALEGNLHFVFTQRFDEPQEVARYDAFMDAVAQLVAVEYGGSLKAEHGTGRNMAPYIELEWGSEGYALMVAIKRAFDPYGVLNPDVMISSDAAIHLKNLKALPAAHEIVDKCIECGFCEPACPARELTLSPRQRITVWREMLALQASGDDPARLAVFERDYGYLGIDTCAATGLCQQHCPVGINTGDFIRALRASHAHTHHEPARYVAEHFSVATGVVRMGLRAAGVAQGVLGDRVLQQLSQYARHHLPALPQWNTALPTAAARRPRPQHRSTRKVVYFASCASRTLGPSRYDDDLRSLVQVTVGVLERAGYEVIFPAALDEQCCGQPFESKGHFSLAEQKRQQVFDALAQASQHGQYPIYVDTSPCALRLLSASNRQQLNIFDSIPFLAEHVLPHLTVKPVDESIAVHLTCSSRKMGVDQHLLRLVKACAQRVTVPEFIGCCGFAGDKGFTTPELNDHALRDLSQQVSHCDSGVSSSRTCEIGLSSHSGLHYRHAVYLLDRASRS